MSQLFLDSVQTKVVLQSHDPVSVCDPEGNVLGVIAPAPTFRGTRRDLYPRRDRGSEASAGSARSTTDHEGSA